MGEGVFNVLLVGMRIMIMEEGSELMEESMIEFSNFVFFGCSMS